MVQLNDELVALLDREAAGRGISRSAVIRDAIAAYFAESTEKRIDALIRDGYTRVQPATPDEWGDMDRIADRSTRELAQRLDAEEREQGWGGW